MRQLRFRSRLGVQIEIVPLQSHSGKSQCVNLHPGYVINGNAALDPVGIFLESLSGLARQSIRGSVAGNRRPISDRELPAGQQHRNRASPTAQRRLLALPSSRPLKTVNVAGTTLLLLSEAQSAGGDRHEMNNNSETPDRV